MLTKVGLRTMVIDLRTIAITLFIWAVTTVAAQNIEIVVHRGANALAPENTWPSAEAALQYGACSLICMTRLLIVLPTAKACLRI